MDAALDGVLRIGSTRPQCLAAWEAFVACRATGATVVAALDDEVHALRPSSTARQASRGMGARLLRTWQQTPSPGDSSLADLLATRAR